MTHSKLLSQAVKDDVAVLTAAHKLRYLHLRKPSLKYEEMPASKGGCTIAYTKEHPQDNVVFVSTALVNDSDAYCKAHGRAIAAQRFDKGFFIAVHVPKNISTSYFLKQMFTPMVSM